jgi:hypothetical protein
MLNDDVVAKISSIIQDLREKIVVGRIVHDDVGIIVILDNFVKGNDSLVTRRNLVQGNLTNVVVLPALR